VELRLRHEGSEEDTAEYGSGSNLVRVDKTAIEDQLSGSSSRSD